MLSINVEQHGNTIHRVVLGNIAYNMRVSWNTRSEKWEMDLSFSDGTVIAKGITILPDIDLVKTYRYSGFEGVLVVVNVKSNYETKLTFDNFGFNKTFELLWVSEEELGELI